MTMNDIFYIKRNDTGPAYKVTLYHLDQDGNRTVVDLTGASGTFHMYDKDGVQKVSGSITIVDAANGVAQYNWQAGDTDVADDYQSEIEITYADSSIETFPNYEHAPIRS